MERTPLSKVVRIGGACAFYGDSSVAPTQLIKAGVDYLILDYLAEATMAAFGGMRKAGHPVGFATDFTEWVWKDNLRELKATGTKIVTNAGGLTPKACVERMHEIAKEAGLSFKIAYVTGDDIMDRVPEISGHTEMFTGERFPPADQIMTVNAYLGGSPIARALAMGADVVITGRCVDSALTLGILMHEFGWRSDEHDKLAQGSLAGHVIECGAQGSGGLFTDWEQVPDWANVGYPIVECHADGSFVVTKPPGHGRAGERSRGGRADPLRGGRSAGLHAARCGVRFLKREREAGGRGPRARDGGDGVSAERASTRCVSPGRMDSGASASWRWSGAMP